MTHHHFSRVAVLSLIVLIPATVRSGWADPVTVQSGGFFVDYGDPGTPWRFVGPGFAFEFHLRETDSSYLGHFATCSSGNPSCVTGAPIDLSARYEGMYAVANSTTLGFERTRPAEIGGVSYPILYFSGDMRFDALGTAAPRVTAPFNFSAHITAFTNPSLTGPPVFDADLVGFGTARAILGRIFLPADAPPDQLGILGFGYTFADSTVPEPSTLVLVGSALGAAGLRWRRRRRAQAAGRGEAAG